MRGNDRPIDATFLELKRGRGKGASLRGLFRLANDNAVFEVGTPTNSEILNITANGEFYGVHSEREEPPTYETNDERSALMKATLNQLVGPVGEGKRLRLESQVPEYNGLFTVIRGRLEKGKYGQVHLWLCPEGQEPSEDNTVEFWSYRHSGIITAFEVL